MRLFVIPSWYTTRKDTNSGIFFSEQMNLILSECVDSKIFVSSSNYLSLSVKVPKSFLKAALEYVADISFNGLKDQRPDRNLLVSQSTLFRWTDYFLSGGYFLARRKVFRDFAFAEKQYSTFDSIIAFSTDPAALIGAELSRKTGLPLIIIEHMGPFPIKSWTNKRGVIKKKLIKSWNESDVVAAVSSNLAEKIRPFCDLEVQILHNPISLEFIAAAKAILANGRGEVQNKILAVSRLVDNKGIKDLIEAFSEICDQSIHLEVVGYGPKEQEFREFANSLGISERIIWSGRQSRDVVREKMLASKFLVMPSYSETFSLVCVEALACGLPVVATKCGGPEDIIVKGVGELVEPQSVQALREGMNCMLQNLDNFSSVNLAKYALDNFGPKVFVKQLEGLIKLSLERRSA
jgi:glycosyltransferase involved in cell wall biosynthesis